MLPVMRTPTQATKTSAKGCRLHHNNETTGAGDAAGKGTTTAPPHKGAEGGEALSGGAGVGDTKLCI